MVPGVYQTFNKLPLFGQERISSIFQMNESVETKLEFEAGAFIHSFIRSSLYKSVVVAQ